MPKCNPRCPVVKQQLRKLATEAPWILKDATPDQCRAPPDQYHEAPDQYREAPDQYRGALTYRRLATDRDAASSIRTEDGTIVSSKVGSKRDEDGKSSSIGTYDVEYKGQKDVMVEVPADQSSVRQRKIRTSATQWDGFEPMIRTDMATLMEQSKIDKASSVGRIDKTDRASSASRIDQAKKLDKETLKHEVTDEATEISMFRDECDISCPRRISRQRRLYKLEETQCMIDYYLLNKGTRYFDDVCTCSLSCVLRALRQDPFIKSTFAAIALFTVGLKLCSELDAWYLPIQFS